MADNSSGPPRRKLSLIAPMALGLALLAILAAAWLLRPRPAPEPTAPPPAAPTPPVEDAVLDRPGLLEAAAGQAAAFADGVALEGEDPLVGRRFAIRMPFGCEGPSTGSEAAQAFYEFDARSRTLRLVAHVSDWTASPIVQALPGGDVEAVEGFWLERPWSHAETCPKPDGAAPSQPPSPASAQTLGLARLFEAEGSRTERRGARPYEHVIKLGEPEASPTAAGYRLALSGRIAAFPDGRATRCWSQGRDQRPVCLLAVVFERVAFEDGNSGRTLAEWPER